MLINVIFVGSSQDDAQACLAALFLTDPIDDRDKLISAKGSRVDGTCEWITENTLYRSWLESRSQLMWLSGGPGKGKTMLSIYLAEHLESTSKDALVLQYFCDDKDERRNTTIALLRGLLFQLFRLRPELMTYILPIFKEQKQSIFGKPSFETLWRIFENILHDTSLGSVYCVLDGLDECDRISLKAFLKRVTALFPTKVGETSSSRLRLLIVSRDFPDFIPEILSDFPRVRLDFDSNADTKVSHDISQFIDVKVNELAIRKKYPPALRAFVKNTFQRKAQGTFLWVSLVLVELDDCNAIEVERTLDLFPADLDGCYSRILLQIHPGRRKLAAKLLRWIVMAVRPLKLSELGAILADDNRQSNVPFDRNEVTKMQLSCCGHLLTMKNDEVGLIHQSAKEYLLRPATDSNPILEAFRVEGAEANAEIATTCFDYLHDGALTESESRPTMDSLRVDTFPLLPYAALYWPEHARSLNRTERIFDLSLPFYQKDSQVRESWLWMYWQEMKMGWPIDLNLEQRTLFPLLHIACVLGLLPLVENLLSPSGLFNQVKLFFNVRQRNHWGSTALHLAVWQGNTAVVQLLLDKGADLTAKKSGESFPYWTALEEAAERGHVNVVQLLLNRQDRLIERRKAILTAAEYGRNDVITSVLNRGGHIIEGQKLASTLGVAMLSAAYARQESTVRLLLKTGAEVDFIDKGYGPALFIAVVIGDEATVQLLLANGADPNLRAEHKHWWTDKAFKYQTVLHVAVRFGNENLVRLLLEYGADIEARYTTPPSRHLTPLHLAAECNFVDVLTLLLEKGADIHAVDADGNTVLHCAAGCYSHPRLYRLVPLPASGSELERTVRLLLDKGVNTQIKNTNGKLALDVTADQAIKELLRID